jgi:uncharacterized repeat protein (TIGR04076 family)
MPKCKITVVKRMVNPDLIDEYMEEEHRGYDPCDRFEDDQEFIVDGWNQVPDGFCAYAWADIHREVAVLLSGGSYQPWIKEGTTITCCTDGLRPVVFKIERTE